MSGETIEGPRDGETFVDERDLLRLNRQARTVFVIMRDGNWRTLGQIADMTGEPEASVSARLRDLRNPRFGGFQVDREYVEKGLWQYRVLPPKPPEQLDLLEAAE